MASLESTIAGDGCIMQWMTPASSTYWWSGVWGTNRNKFNIWFNYKGLSIKPTGDAVISGNLDVNVSNNRPSIRAYNTMDGYISYVKLEAKWNSQGYLNFESNRSGANYLFLTAKDDLRMYCGNNLVQFFQNYNTCIR